MNQKTNRIKTVCVLLLLAAVGIGGFFLGKAVFIPAITDVLEAYPKE